jgi:hypothetical protein
MLTVENSPLINIGREFSFRVREKREINVFLLWAKVIASNNHSSRRKTQIISFLKLETG